MSNEMVEQFRKLLIDSPERKLASDPMAVAWGYRGVRFSHPHGNYHFWYGASANTKLLLVAVATLNVQGLPATPLAVHELLGGTLTYNTVRRSLKRQFDYNSLWVVKKAGYSYSSEPPLTRLKIGRTYQYFICEPEQEGVS